MLETVKFVLFGFHHNYGRKNSLGSPEVKPDQGGLDLTCCRWSNRFMSFKIHVEERLTPPVISPSGVPKVQKNEGGRAKGGNQGKLNLPSEHRQTLTFLREAQSKPYHVLFGWFKRARLFKMSHIERLKLLLFLVKDASINYHVAIWMPHTLLTLLHRSIHSLHAFYLATFVCVFTGLKFVRSRLELPGLELLSPDLYIPSFQGPGWRDSGSLMRFLS